MRRLCGIDWLIWRRWACSPASRRRSRRPAPAREPIQTSVPHAILIEAETGTVLFEKARRPAGRAGEPRQADDGRGGVRPDRARQHHARRRIRRQRERLAQGRGAVARLDHVCGHPQPREGAGSAAGRHHPVRQRRLHRAGRGHRRQRGRIRAA